MKIKSNYIFYQNYANVYELLKTFPEIRNALIITKFRNEQLYQLENGDMWRIKKIKSIDSITGLYWDKAYVEYAVVQTFPEIIEYIKDKHLNYKIF